MNTPVRFAAVLLAAAALAGSSCGKRESAAAGDAEPSYEELVARADALEKEARAAVARAIEAREAVKRADAARNAETPAPEPSAAKAAA
ncbi:MAG: hypothetical protein II839_09280, partial [Kiritimatiellae bacterium]|nr:hypothetical protein [Kiritimatiellia bacterium]